MLSMCSEVSLLSRDPGGVSDRALVLAAGVHEKRGLRIARIHVALTRTSALVLPTWNVGTADIAF